MFDSGSIRLSNARYVVAGTLILVLLAALPLTAAAGHANNSSLSGDGIYDPAAGGFARLAGISASNSGDDLYDPAAGFAGFADRSVSFVASISGDADYDSAAGGFAWLAGISASNSGDDLYDPAAGFAGFADGPASFVASLTSLSGDAAYDPAAGGLAALSTFPLSAALSDVSGCYQAAVASIGGFSGDDAYDPAAGGNPDGDVVGLACLLDTSGIQ